MKCHILLFSKTDSIRSIIDLFVALCTRGHSGHVLFLWSDDFTLSHAYKLQPKKQHIKMTKTQIHNGEYLQIFMCISYFLAEVNSNITKKHQAKFTTNHHTLNLSFSMSENLVLVFLWIHHVAPQKRESTNSQATLHFHTHKINNSTLVLIIALWQVGVFLFVNAPHKRTNNTVTPVHCNVTSFLRNVENP